MTGPRTPTTARPARRPRRTRRPESICQTTGHQYGPPTVPPGARLPWSTCSRCGDTILVSRRPS